MVLTRTLYGEEAAKRPDLLPEQDKERIRTLSSAVAAVVGGVAGSRDGGGNAVDVLANAQVGGVVGRNAVENNYLLESDWSDYYRQMRACGNNERCIDNTREWLTRRSAWRNFLLDGICRRDIQRCREKHTDATRSARLTSIHMNIGRGPILSNPQNIRNSRFSTSTPRYDPRRPDLNALSYYDRVAKNIQPSDYLLTRENLNTLNQLAKHPAIQEEYRNNPSFRSEFKSEAEAAMRASFGDNEMWRRDEPKLYGFEIINRQNPQDQIQYPVGAGGLKPVYPELWLIPAPKIGILGSFSSKLFAGLERSGGGKVLQWMARVQPASERALVLNSRKQTIPVVTRSLWQASPNWELMYQANVVPKMEGAATQWTVRSGKVAENVVQTARQTGKVTNAARVAETAGQVTQIESPKAGAGGHWNVMDEKIHPDVIKQISPTSCGAACGEMLLRDRNIFVNQSKFGLSVKSDTQLARELTNLSNHEWAGSGVTINSFDALNRKGSWAAMMVDSTGSNARHWVVVRGVNDAGKVIIHDPWEGTRYLMTREEFFNSWSLYAVYPK